MGTWRFEHSVKIQKKSGAVRNADGPTASARAVASQGAAGPLKGAFAPQPASPLRLEARTKDGQLERLRVGQIDALGYPALRIEEALRHAVGLSTDERATVRAHLESLFDSPDSPLAALLGTIIVSCGKPR
jgi:hypothetical protein